MIYNPVSFTVVFSVDIDGRQVALLIRSCRQCGLFNAHNYAWQ